MPRRGGAGAPAARVSRPPTSTVTCWQGATLSARLLPLVDAFPWLLDHQTRAQSWAELLLAEDPTSPDVLELVALIWGRRGRPGDTERMLMELAYHSPDRAAGIARGAAVWEKVGRPREACAQWIRAARWRDDPEDPTWRIAIACARRDPGAGDPKAIRDYVVTRARPERRDAIAAELDARPPPAPTAARRRPTVARRDGGGRSGAVVTSSWVPKRRSRPLIAPSQRDRRRRSRRRDRGAPGIRGPLLLSYFSGTKSLAVAHRPLSTTYIAIALIRPRESRPRLRSFRRRCRRSHDDQAIDRARPGEGDAERGWRRSGRTRRSDLGRGLRHHRRAGATLARRW